MIAHESRVVTIERARRALARRRQARNAASDEAAKARDILAVVSHDLRNPLATIAMAISRLGDGTDVPERRRTECLKLANASIEWMQRMIQDLLDAASIDAGRLSVEQRESDLVVLLVLAASMFEDRCAELGITLKTELPERLPRVNIDADRILQLVGNLMSNAVKFAPSGSRITLSVIDRGRDVVVSVRDEGPGIPAEHVPHLFDRFWHARRGARSQGTGLGLCIAKGIAEAHDGHLWVETIEGLGSTFLFSIPQPLHTPRTATAVCGAASSTPAYSRLVASPHH